MFFTVLCALFAFLLVLGVAVEVGHHLGRRFLGSNDGDLDPTVDD